MKIKTILLCSVALTLGACSAHNNMHESSGPHHPYKKADNAENHMDKKSSKLYEEKKDAMKIVSSYTVFFDYDKSSIRDNEKETLDLVIREIEKYKPRQVTVIGYTDSLGTADYNQTLSHRREQAVSKALLERGMDSGTLRREARGEYDQAVETKNGVKNQENRRVVIDFRG